MRYGYDMDTAARTTMNVLAVDDFRRVAAMAHALGTPGRRNHGSSTARPRASTAAIAHPARPAPTACSSTGSQANGTPSTHASQQANAYALAFGIVPAAHVDAVADYVVGSGTAMGVVEVRRICSTALHAGGRDDALVTALTDPNRPGYAQILREGATFTWESWDARADRRQRVARLRRRGPARAAGRHARRAWSRPAPRRSRYALPS